MSFIYKPKGKAAEYGDYAINIYTGCGHRCFYCFSPSVLHREKEAFHGNIRPRDGIVEGVKDQLKQNGMKNKLIHLCFVCDPYPLGYDSRITREIIQVIKESGNHVQILTKNGTDAMRDFDLLDENDWVGITYAGYEIGEFEVAPAAEPGADTPHNRLIALETAHKKGIKTWISCEPVLNAEDVLGLIELANYVDLWKVGKLNYHPSDIDWKDFGTRAEAILKIKKKYNGCDYYIKESLKKEMEA